jgi:hypothetical protein
MMWESKKEKLNMKKFFRMQWPAIFLSFAFLFNACSTSMQAPTAVEVSPTQTDAPTETFTPEPIATQTATSTPEATATPTQSKETTTPAPTSEVQYLIPKDILLNNNMGWLEIYSKDMKTIATRGSTYGCLTIGQEKYLVAPVIFHNSKSRSPETSENIPAGTFKPGTLGEWKNNQIDPSAINDGSFAAWVKQQYGNPSDSVVIGLVPYADQVAGIEGLIKAWQSNPELDFVSGSTDSEAKLLPGPAVEAYFEAHPEITQKIADFSTTANISDLDGAVLELVISQ